MQHRRMRGDQRHPHIGLCPRASIKFKPLHMPRGVVLMRCGDVPAVGAGCAGSENGHGAGPSCSSSPTPEAGGMARLSVGHSDIFCYCPTQGTVRACFGSANASLEPRQNNSLNLTGSCPVSVRAQSRPADGLVKVPGLPVPVLVRLWLPVQYLLGL